MKQARFPFGCPTGALSTGVLPVVLVLLAATACAEGKAEQPAAPLARPPVPAQVLTVSTTSFSLEVQAVGSIRSPETTIISSDTSGIIVALDAPEGRSIAKGHLIARLDDQEDRAALRVAEARRTNARAVLDRVKPLWEGGVVSQQEYDDAVAEMTTAEGLLDESSTRLRKTRISAPFSGILGIQTAQVGQYISSGDAIVELTKVDPLELIFNVPEEQAGSVQIGQTVLARVGRCGEAFEAVVEALDPAIDPDTRSLPVQARVGNAGRRLLPGMSARVRLQVGEQSEAVVVPHEALATQGTSYVAWVLDEADQVQVRNVTVGRFLTDGVEIVAGLEPGERIVGAGHQKLRPGATVKPLPWEPTENPNLALGSTAGDDCI